MTRTACTKRTAIKKTKRKKVAPKVIPGRPRKDQSTSETSQDSVSIPDDSTIQDDDTTISIVTTPTIQSDDLAVTIATPPVSQPNDTIITIETTSTLSILDAETQVVPLPTLPEEGNGIHTPPLELPDAEDIVGDLFMGEHTEIAAEKDKDITDKPLSIKSTPLAVTETEKATEQDKAETDKLSSIQNTPPAPAEAEKSFEQEKETTDVSIPLTEAEKNVDKEVVDQEDGNRGRSRKRGRSVSVASTGEVTCGEETVAERSEVVATRDVETTQKIPSRSRKVCICV